MAHQEPTIKRENRAMFVISKFGILFTEIRINHNYTMICKDILLIMSQRSSLTFTHFETQQENYKNKLFYAL